MKHFKSIIGAAGASVILFVAFSGSAFAQEQTVEQKALSASERMQLDAISTQAESDNPDLKQQALDNIKFQFIGKKKKTEEVRKILRDLAEEGIRDQVRSEGRVANNNPYIRKQAIILLGEFSFNDSDPEVAVAAEKALLQISQDDPYPDNVAAAFDALSKIAMTDPDPERAKQVVDTMNFRFRNFDSKAAPQVGSLNGPSGDDLLAAQYIQAIKKMALNGTLKNDPQAFELAMLFIQDVAAGGGNGYGQKQKYKGPVLAQAKALLQILAQQKQESGQ